MTQEIRSAPGARPRKEAVTPTTGDISGMSGDIPAGFEHDAFTTLRAQIDYQLSR